MEDETRRLAEQVAKEAHTDISDEETAQEDVGWSDGDGDYHIIGPECFTDRDKEVISYQGENYYRGCGELVSEWQAPDGSEGGATHCVKRVNHISWKHEDWDGNTRSRWDGPTKIIGDPVRTVPAARLYSFGPVLEPPHPSWMIQNARVLEGKDSHDMWDVLGAVMNVIVSIVLLIVVILVLYKAG